MAGIPEVPTCVDVPIVNPSTLTEKKGGKKTVTKKRKHGNMIQYREFQKTDAYRETMRLQGIQTRHLLPHKRLAIEGKRFGRLIAIESIKRGKFVKWKCLCDCGTIKYIGTSLLIAGKTKSCGCLRSEIHRRGNLPGESAMKKLYRAYRGHCKKVNRQFDLTIQQFNIITKQRCYYCGEEPFATVKGAGNGDYSYNGIDRIDSMQGYVKENIVASCKHCNIAKQRMSQQEFLCLVKKIYNNLELGGHNGIDQG
jgi:hypothetical protein